MKTPSFLRNSRTGILTASLLLAGWSLSAQAIERINLDTMGNQASGPFPGGARISADGNFAVWSTDSALDPSDNNGLHDVYLRDLNTNVVSRVSVDATGGDPDENSTSPAISADGRFVAFESRASDLLGAGIDTNSLSDIFVRDVVNGVTTRVSVATGGAQSTSGFAGSTSPSITGNGRYVAFSSGSDDLIVGDNNGNEDIFLHDRIANSTVRLNLGPLSAEASGGESSSPAIAENGSVVFFLSSATNLVPGVTSGNPNIFGRDLMSNSTFLASKTAAGAEPNGDCLFPSVSADGNLVVYASSASNLVPIETSMGYDIYLFDRSGDTTTLVSANVAGTPANGFTSNNARISGNGAVVGFTTDANNLLWEPSDSGVYDLYVKDLASGKIALVSVGLNGANPNGNSDGFPDFTDDGSAVIFSSLAGNLVPNDTNMSRDIFIGRMIKFQPDDQPDNLIGKNTNIFAASGDNIYNATGGGQKLTRISRKARPVTAFWFIQNDGVHDDTFTLKGPIGNAYFKISYFLGANNETAAIKQGVFTTDSIAPPEHQVFRVICKPSRSRLKKVKKVRGRKRRTVWLKRNYTAKLTSTSTSDQAAKDTAALLIKHK